MKKDSTIDILANAGFDVNSDISLPEVEKLTKDLKHKIITIGHVEKSEIRACVNTFYQIQKMRKELTEQIRSIENNENAETSITILRWVIKNIAAIENSLERCLRLICESDKVGRWLLSIVGIGPVLAAGCLAYFDVEGRQYATQFMSYAGLNDNNRPWLSKEKSTKIVNDIIGSAKTITDDHVILISAKTQWSYEHIRSKGYNEKTGKWSKVGIINAVCMIPYNATVKSFCWKIGESFHWLMNNPNSYYGTLFAERKVYETTKNERGDYADQAYERMNQVGKSTEAYKAYSQGMLPKNHINNRVVRWVAKVFISHLFEEMYRVRYDEIPARYYTVAKMGELHNKEYYPEVPYDLVTSERESFSPEKIARIENKRMELLGINNPTTENTKTEEVEESLPKFKYTCDCGETKRFRMSKNFRCPSCNSPLHKIEE